MQQSPTERLARVSPRRAAGQASHCACVDLRIPTPCALAKPAGSASSSPTARVSHQRQPKLSPRPACINGLQPVGLTHPSALPAPLPPAAALWSAPPPPPALLQSEQRPVPPVAAEGGGAAGLSTAALAPPMPNEDGDIQAVVAASRRRVGDIRAVAEAATPAAAAAAVEAEAADRAHRERAWVPPAYLGAFEGRALRQNMPLPSAARSPRPSPRRGNGAPPPPPPPPLAGVGAGVHVSGAGVACAPPTHADASPLTAGAAGAPPPWGAAAPSPRGVPPDETVEGLQTAIRAQGVASALPPSPIISAYPAPLPPPQHAVGGGGGGDGGGGGAEQFPADRWGRMGARILASRLPPLPLRSLPHRSRPATSGGG